MIKKKSLSILSQILTILLLISSFIPSTYGYYSESINDSFSIYSTSFSIGQWLTDSSLPKGVINLEENIYPNDFTYPKGSVLYLNGEYYTVTQEWVKNETIFNNVNGTWWATEYKGWRWLPNNVMTKNKIITHEGTVYQLKDKNTNDPANQPPSDNWLYKTITTDQLKYPLATVYPTQYKLYDAVYYNHQLFQVVNEAQANMNTPGTLNGGWNRIDSYDYNNYNQYSYGDIAIYHNTMYFALKANTNQPPSPSNVTNNYTNPQNAIWLTYDP